MNRAPENDGMQETVYGRTMGFAAAIGVGIGAAFAASMGSIGYLLGLAGAMGTFVLAREIQRRRRA
jgi:hypothetical protein